MNGIKKIVTVKKREMWGLGWGQEQCPIALKGKVTRTKTDRNWEIKALEGETCPPMPLILVRWGLVVKAASIKGKHRREGGGDWQHNLHPTFPSAKLLNIDQAPIIIILRLPKKLLFSLHIIINGQFCGITLNLFLFIEAVRLLHCTQCVLKLSSWLCEVSTPSERSYAHIIDQGPLILKTRFF